MNKIMKINLKSSLVIIIMITIILSMMVIPIKSNSTSTPKGYSVDSTVYKSHTYYIFHQGSTNTFVHSPECEECYRLFD